MTKKNGSYAIAGIFGPTFQGEGPQVGRPCYFVRFAGCDSRCSWCDSKFAYEDQHPKLAPESIVKKLLALRTAYGEFPLTIFTGGNPLIWNAFPILKAMEESGKSFEVAVETQGTTVKPWLNHSLVSTVVVSPKLQSSGATRGTNSYKRFRSFVDYIPGKEKLFWKFTIFTREDIRGAFTLCQELQLKKVWMAMGTFPEDTREALGIRFANFTKYIMQEKQLSTERREIYPEEMVMLPQLHVLAYLHGQGV